MQILTEPKNALVRQFEQFFAMDGVELTFTPEALDAIAADALKEGTGARGLRTVVEDLLLDVMFEVPSRPDVKKCVVNADTIKRLERPLLLNEQGARSSTRQFAVGATRRRSRKAPDARGLGRRSAPPYSLGPAPTRRSARSPRPRRRLPRSGCARAGRPRSRTRQAPQPGRPAA